MLLKVLFFRFIRFIYPYILTILFWVFLFHVINETRDNNLLSIDSIITTITLASLMLQNMESKVILRIQDELAKRISIKQFFLNSCLIFFILAFIILPVFFYEFKEYFLDELNEYNRLSKLFMTLTISYSIFSYSATFFGDKIDKNSDSSLNKKYSVFYGILLILYITIKLTIFIR